MPKYVRVRKPVIDYVEEGTLNEIVDEAVERFRKYASRDEEFVARFGRWRRPGHAPTYPVELWANRWIRWHPEMDGVIDVERFVRSFPDKADRVLVGEIARFVSEPSIGLFATDKTLNSFRIELLRRLDAVGF